VKGRAGAIPVMQAFRLHSRPLLPTARENRGSRRSSLQDSAYPVPRLNQRITADATPPTPPLASRRRGAIRSGSSALRADQLHTSGPTTACLARAPRRRDYAAILAADRASRRRFSGHGSALAQGYNHMILPLASRRRQDHPGALGDRRLVTSSAGNPGDVAARDASTSRRSRCSPRRACASPCSPRTSCARAPARQPTGHDVGGGPGRPDDAVRRRRCLRGGASRCSFTTADLARDRLRAAARPGREPGRPPARRVPRRPRRVELVHIAHRR